MTTTKKVPAKAPEQTMVKVSELTTVQKARLAASPSLNGATVIQAYQGNVMGKDVELGGLIDQLRDTFTEVKGGDLHTLEAMLISQATGYKPFLRAWPGVPVRRIDCLNIKLFWGLL